MYVYQRSPLSSQTPFSMLTYALNYIATLEILGVELVMLMKPNDVVAGIFYPAMELNSNVNQG